MVTITILQKCVIKTVFKKTQKGHMKKCWRAFFCLQAMAWPSLDKTINIKKFGAILCGKKDHTAQSVYLNRQDWTRVLSPGEG